ncbi:MAG: hypothetical protein NTU77_01025 [Actinobacteria bacterium]|nr:hypothetical protein [Actinomycetota bacterium]
MGESLSPVEVAHEAHRHSSHGSGHETPSGHRRILQIIEAALLAGVTILAAWSGFAAASYSTDSRVAFAASARADTDADEQALEADSIENFDEAAFNAWLVTDLLGDVPRADVARERFSPALDQAFDAWIQLDPETNASAPATPFVMDEYARPLLRSAETLRLEADRLNRLTVFLAGVLFLIGIGSTFTVVPVRYTLIGVGLVLLSIALVILFALPQPAFDFSTSVDLR